ncbi:sulfotransferase family protein [Streptomyces sp. NRRL F-5126]|uniref:sulfotransferase family protein n=1 Tax=Streptomyces sp. NRRL F-5126 TaxID=1463857 RepID=UPI001F1B054E|nr:sulfotransferase [Streptomyces sp. NRRL F-5126]
MQPSQTGMWAVARKARRKLGRVKARATGRPAAARVTPKGSRLVTSPVFVLSSVRSGSTLLRVLLNSHPLIRAPHEMHLRTLEVKQTKVYTEKAMKQLGLDGDELEHLLWDRILHRELSHSGKELIVDKTPGNALIWRRLHEAWPDARFVFLLRHPASMVSSLINGRPDRELAQTVAEVKQYVDAVEEARGQLPGLTVRYEELTEKPTEVTQEICAFLGVEWDRRMLNYGKQEHGPFQAFIGDWSDNIKSGKIQQARELPRPDEVPDSLKEVTRHWGYEC